MEARILSFYKDYGVRGHGVITFSVLCQMLTRLSEGIDAVNMISYDILNHSVHGIVQSSDCVIHVDGENKSCCFCIANRAGCSMTVVKYENERWRSIVCSGIGNIDLDVNGKRWEGGIESDNPFGYGILFDEEGHIEYEGFVLNGLKICYGEEYYSDIDSIKYSGGFCCDEKCGHGVLYDRCDKRSEGLWYKGDLVPRKTDDITITSYMQSVCLDQSLECLSHPFLLSGFMTCLQSFTVSDNCMTKVPHFVVSNVPNLEEIIIGSMCFCHSRLDSNVFKVLNCPHLNKISIGNYSFHLYSVFKLLSLPQLKTLVIGWSAFTRVTSFQLTGRFIAVRLLQISLCCNLFRWGTSRSGLAG